MVRFIWCSVNKPQQEQLAITILRAGLQSRKSSVIRSSLRSHGRRRNLFIATTDVDSALLGKRLACSFRSALRSPNQVMLILPDDDRDDAIGWVRFARVGRPKHRKRIRSEDRQ